MVDGAGIRGGYVHGSSEKFGAYPGTDPVTPAQFAETLYHCMGIPPETMIRGGLNRPFRLAEAEPAGAILGH